MNQFLEKTKAFFKDKSLRNRLFFVLAMFVIFRLMAGVPIPGVDAGKLSQFLSNNQFFGILNVFSGGGLSQLSIIMLGVGPYITASIIMQLLTVIFPGIKSMYQEEGEAGRKKFAQYSRFLTVPLAFLQGFALMAVLARQGIFIDLTLFQKTVSLSVVVAGSMLLIWIGDLISEFGIGNGVSLIIFAGIVSVIPREIASLLFTYDDPSQLPLYLTFIVVGLLIIAAVVFITEAERPIPVTYARRGAVGTNQAGTVQTYLPIRVNQAGVMPIIFALSILLFPQLIGNLLAGSSHAVLQSISKVLLSFSQTSWLYAVLYFIFVFLFTYFYTAVTFEPKSMASNLQKSGAFIPGVRPGEATENFIGSIVSRITFLGAVFLGLVAVLPLIVQKVTGITAIAIGGTALLIVVSVVIDLLKKSDAQLSMREY